MAYDPEIIAAIERRAAQIKDPSTRDRYRRAAGQIAIVESGVRNLDYGDSDSKNYRQERESIYGGQWAKTGGALNTEAITDRLFREFAQFDRGQPSWQLAADVQRPAAQYRGRYKDVAKQAAALFSGGVPSSGGAGSPSGAATGPSGSGPAAAPTAPNLLGQNGTADFTSILAATLGQSQPQQPTSSPIAAPAFSAQLKLPAGVQALAPVAAPQAPAAGDRLTGALSLVEALGASAPTAGSTGQSQASAGAPMPSIVERVADARSGGQLEPTEQGAETALAWARSKVGAPGSSEAGGENRGKLADYANSRFGMSGQPWCAMFTSLAVTKGGAPRTARTASVAEVRRRALAGAGYQKGLVNPGRAMAGDLILFGDDHIGMVDHVTDGKIFYVGGNQSDSVTIASVPVGKGDIVRPKYGARR